MTETQLPALLGGFTAVADVDVPTGGASGVLCALGDRHSGWAFYLVDGRPVAVFEILGGRTRVAADATVGPGAHAVGLRYETGDPGRVVLTVDGDDVASEALAGLMLFPALIPSGGGLLVGRDRGISMSDDYRCPFPFTGRLHRLTLASASPGADVDPATEAEIIVRSD